jgi:hypothetical protein
MPDVRTVWLLLELAPRLCAEVAAMVLHQERRASVQTLRQVALRYGVERVTDTAKRDAVLRMADGILQHTGISDNDRDKVLRTKAVYESTFGAVVAQEPPAAPASVSDGHATTAEWKFHAAQLTYNSVDGDWASADKIVLRALFDRFVSFVDELSKQLKMTKASITMEESLATGTHVHIHLYFHTDSLYHRRNLDPFTFEGIHPHVVANRARGNAFSGAVRHGHFYVVAEKVGTLFTWTNFVPFREYPVEAWWVDNLFRQEKLSRDTYLQYAKRLGVGFARRLADVTAAERYEKECAMRDAVQREQAALADKILPMRTFPEIEQYLTHFQGEALHRRPILAIVGGTNLGKSMLAANVVRRVGEIIGVGGYLEITVECNEHLDFADFDPRHHAGVVLDGVGDALILKANREALQGRAKLCKGGQSATNMYSYVYTLCNKAVVATFDLSAQNLMALKTDHWLANPKNVILLELRSKGFIEPSAESVPMPSFAPQSGDASPPRTSPRLPARKRRWATSPASASEPQMSANVDLAALPTLPLQP